MTVSVTQIIPIIIFRGIGQIMLQCNALTGLLFVIGILINSPSMAIAAVIGSAGGTTVAYLFRFPTIQIEAGLYGFNGSLVAIATIFFWPLSLTTIVIGLLGICFSTFVMKWMHQKSLQPFTFPFVVTVWAMIYLSTLFPFASSNPLTYPHSSGIHLLDSISQAFGQVMFQANWITGLVFISAVFLNSKKAAVFGIFGTLLAFVICTLFQWPDGQISEGLLGFNAVLCAIALSSSSRPVLMSLIGTMVSVLLMKRFMLEGITALTFPFVLSTWIMLLTERYLNKAIFVKRDA